MEKNYSLEDAVLWEDKTSLYRFMVWRPSLATLVLGNGNTAEESVFLENATKDGLVIVKRPSGGHAVLLTPQMLVVSAVHNREHPWASKKYFAHYNTKIISSLEHFGIEGLKMQGISDITLNHRKIAGSAMYRNPNRAFFHAVLNVGESPELLEKYLRYPKTAPDYRRQRSHRDFVTSLYAEGWNVQIEKLQQVLVTQMTDNEAQ